jgi:Restriction endonuclease NotI
MAGRLVEFFGYTPLDPAGKPYADNLECPFVQSACIKPKHGGCSLEQKGAGEAVIICPNRLYENHHAVLGDIAVQAFGPGVALTKADEINKRKGAGTLTGNEVAVFGKYWGSELSIPQPGDEDLMGGFYIDYVMARLNRSGELLEFTATEIQTIDTTGTYRAQADAFFKQKPFVDSRKNNPGWTSAGLNWANVSKRILPQLIYKGHVLRREKLCHKGLFFVCPTAVLKRIIMRLGGKMLDYPIAAGTITFQAYDLGPLQPKGKRRSLIKGETFTTTVEQVAFAFVSPVNLPKIGVYEAAIAAALAK